MKSLALVVAAAGAFFGGAACSGLPNGPARQPRALPYTLNGPLVPARMTMVTAWDVPDDPLTDAALGDSRLANEIRLGYRIFTNTPAEAERFTPSRMSCNNCHLNAGQRERALPLVDVAGMFPEYNRRVGRLISLNDRIVECFIRSENGAARLEAKGESLTLDPAVLPTPMSREVLALQAYLVWLSRGAEVGRNPTWRGQNTIASSALIPVEKLDRQQGEAIYTEQCITCHGADGQGVAVGTKRPGPLWGNDSWNDGAGAARIYTLAGIVRYTMPYLNPGSLTDAEAQLVAAFINSKPRPAYPFKDQDYRSEPLPPDSVYYARR
ncbi:MAG: c-type cytochrome [Acidobacteria bacterium]|nr:c-type cytochrome [Acidobacteriota bacterium]